MNILYCGDKNIERGLLMSVLSLIDNVNEPLNVYVLTLNVEYNGRIFLPVSDVAVSYIDVLLRKQHEESFCIKIDMTQRFNRIIPEANMSTRFTPCCMLRLYADEINELPARILYLDNDVICRGNFNEFYYQDMENTEVAGVLDYYGRWFFKRNPFKMDYLNSGVLLMNLKEIKKTGLFRKCRKRCETKKMFMPDQSAINKLTVSKKICERKYNEQRKLHDNTVFQHFTTSFRFFPWIHTITVKPWDISRVHEILKLHEYDDLFERYEQHLQCLNVPKQEEV